ncbi:hypothetical protein MNEG_15729 [Monoraphidium neglectum]|uniref:Telomerase reverse transcriptase n=1 Tax=Monoraphidium neglectum TaxID=145388 RepID=A0A0D2LJT5_9CHLO|nr:hypothetical protein MNEG_15729 [Monoraphidium neglectum]KIY92234.1 hypothetical protein MNEG_15729 [Monoraphidium neglectum]|eukprot:XP_013891254.1 hypothetical protein MNEG_15729 [Monoraphidium neglectum]
MSWLSQQQAARRGARSGPLAASADLGPASGGGATPAAAAPPAARDAERRTLPRTTPTMRGSGTAEHHQQRRRRRWLNGTGEGGGLDHAHASQAAGGTPQASFQFAGGGSGSGPGSGDGPGPGGDVTPVIQCAQPPPQRTPEWPFGRTGARAVAAAAAAAGAEGGAAAVREGRGVGPERPLAAGEVLGGSGREPMDLLVEQHQQQEQASAGQPRTQPRGLAGRQGDEEATAAGGGAGPAAPGGGGGGGGGTDEGDADGGDEGGPLGLLACVVPHRAVSQYVWSVLRHIVPPQLLGSCRNRAALRRGVDLIVRLRRHETVTLHHLLRRLRTSDMPWLNSAPAPTPPASETPQQHAAAAQAGMTAPPPTAQQLGNQLHNQQQQRQHAARRAGAPPGGPPARPAPRSLLEARKRWLAQWVWWLVSEVVVPLLRNSFYVTESEPYRQQVIVLAP